MNDIDSILTEDLPGTEDWNFGNGSQTQIEIEGSVPSQDLPNTEDWHFSVEHETTTLDHCNGTGTSTSLSTTKECFAKKRQRVSNDNHIKSPTVLSERNQNITTPRKQNDDEQDDHSTISSSPSSSKKMILSSAKLQQPVKPPIILPPLPSDIPMAVPISTQRRPFASPLSIASTSSTVDSPTPEKSSKRTRPWFQKKRRRKLKQTSLTFA